jgi:hypothetical protein
MDKNLDMREKEERRRKKTKRKIVEGKREWKGNGGRK